MKQKNYLFKFLLLLMSISSGTMAFAQKSPYLTRILEFMPAPSQFMNELPEYEEGDTPESMRRKVENCLAYNGKVMVSLGSFGGYMVAGFDHTIANVPGEYDFKVYGNAFYADANPNEGGRLGGSCEPGVIRVSYDANKNGIADDPWYEIAGSEYGKPETMPDYKITYYRPEAGKQPVLSPDNPHMSDMEYIRWTDNRGGSGYLPKNVFHTQSYYPEWIEADQITFTGTRLADNGVDESGTGNYFVLYAYDFGYADNHPNTSDKSNIKIEWAVDEKGQKVNLPGIDFIRIHTGVNQHNGWLGECSTEVLGIEDLHPHIEADLESSATEVSGKTFRYWFDTVSGQLYLETENETRVSVVSMTGVQIYSRLIPAGSHQVQLGQMKPGVYVVSAGTKSFKIIKY